MKDKFRHENSGFTLIELVITIAVLAVISVPLLMYFTDSMRHNAQMKEQQNAVIAAQNVLEELKVVDLSLDNQDYLTQAVTPPPGATPFPVTSVAWTPMSTAAPGATPGSSYEVKGNYTLNNQSYLVKAKITPRNQLENDDGNTVVYRRAKVPGMDSSKDMIITEKSSTLANARLFFYEQYKKYCDNPANHTPIDSTVTIDSMSQNIERTIYINAIPEEDETTHNKTGKVVLKATYEYKWKAGAGTPLPGITASTVYSTDVSAVVLDGTGTHNIYLFYTPVNYKDASDNVIVVSDKIVLGGKLSQLSDASSHIITGDPGTGTDKLLYQLYLVADETDRSNADTGVYSAKLLKSSVAGDNFGNYVSAVYTNLATSTDFDISGFAFNTVFSSVANTGVHYDTLLENPQVNRVAEIEVSVYKDTGSSDPVDKNLYTTVNGTKVQSQ